MNWLASLLVGESASVAWAMIGGLAVAAGLIIEKFAEILDDRFLGGYKAHKNLEWAGWFILMLGIFIEVADAGWTAHEISVKSNPWNGSILEISASAFIKVSGNDADLAPWGSPLRVANLMLCENDLEVKMEASTFFPLDADKFERGGGIGIDSGTSIWRAYSLVFQAQGMEAENDVIGFVRPVKDINKVVAVRMDLKFLPKNSKILGGAVDMVVKGSNGNIRKIFQIFPQIDTNAADGTPEYPYFVIATNADHIPTK
jgi:hypothetical protein